MITVQDLLRYRGNVSKRHEKNTTEKIMDRNDMHIKQ